MSKTYNVKVTLREVKGDQSKLIRKFIVKYKLLFYKNKQEIENDFIYED